MFQVSPLRAESLIRGSEMCEEESSSACKQAFLFPPVSSRNLITCYYWEDTYGRRSHEKKEQHRDRTDIIREFPVPDIFVVKFLEKDYYYMLCVCVCVCV